MTLQDAAVPATAIASQAELAEPATTPIAVADRLASLDVLRGIALLCIFVVNVEDFVSPFNVLHDIPYAVIAGGGSHPVLNYLVFALKWCFVEGKMRALFATLFGAGTALLLERLERTRGAGIAADVFHRRNLWLLFFGLLHGFLIWDGDILFFYGLSALVFLHPLRNVAPRHLIVIGALIAIAGNTVAFNAMSGTLRMAPTAILQAQAHEALYRGQALAPAQAESLAEAEAQRRQAAASFPPRIVAGRASYLDSLPRNVSGEADTIAAVITHGVLFEFVGYMMLGMGLFGNGFLKASWRRRSYAIVAAAGYGVGIPATLAGIALAQRAGFTKAAMTLWLIGPYALPQIACMFANAAAIILLVKSGRLLALQRSAAAVGRTAFSNYILTSLVSRLVFSWGPFKLYGDVAYYQQVYVIAAMWAFNIVVSVAWLRVFRFGPLEWAWRSLTYWKLQPLFVGVQPLEGAR